MIKRRIRRVTVATVMCLACVAPSAFGGALKLPQTGQSACYSDNGSPISCQGTGQDGEAKAGQAWPSPRFVAGGITAKDNLTGLTWTSIAKEAGGGGSRGLVRVIAPRFTNLGEGTSELGGAAGTVADANAENALTYVGGGSGGSFVTPGGSGSSFTGQTIGTGSNGSDGVYSYSNKDPLKIYTMLKRRHFSSVPIND